MRVLEKDRAIEAEPEFIDLICELSGEDVRKCYQCGKCTAGCPALEEMDLAPSQVMRAAQVGLRDLVLDSRTIWCCAGCETCAARCPKGLDLSHVMKALTSLAYAEGRTRAAPDIAAFHRSFMDTVGTLGRSYELGLIGLLKLRTRKFFDDLALGMKLFAKGRLNLLPEYVKGNAEVRRLIKEGLRVGRASRPPTGATGETPVVPGPGHVDAAPSPPLPQGEGAGGEAPR
jgi:heterodisulfide reductase subunit C